MAVRTAVATSATTTDKLRAVTENSTAHRRALRLARQQHAARARRAVSGPARLQRVLPRPHVPPPHRAVIDAVAPDLAGVPTHYITDKLEAEGPSMYAAVTAVRLTCLPTTLPSSLDVPSSCVAGPSAPTHFLAVLPVPAAKAPAGVPQPTKATLYPIHDLILAASCSNLSALPPRTLRAAPKPKPAAHPLHSAPPTPDATDDEASDDGTPMLLSTPTTIAAADPENEETTSLLVVPLAVPSPQTFPILLTYLYHRRPAMLLPALLPGIRFASPPSPSPSCPAPKPSPSDTPSDTVRITWPAGTDPAAISAAARRVEGAWRNACALGIADERLWDTLDLAWVIVQGAANRLGTTAPPPPKAAAEVQV